MLNNPSWLGLGWCQMSTSGLQPTCEQQHSDSLQAPLRSNMIQPGIPAIDVLNCFIHLAAAHHGMLLMSACPKSGQQEKKQQHQGHAIESPKKTVVWSFRMKKYLLGDGKQTKTWDEAGSLSEHIDTATSATQLKIIAKIIRGRLCLGEHHFFCDVLGT